MKKIFFAIIFVVMGACVEWYIHLPKKLKIIEIPTFSYVGELKIENNKDDVAHLYENQFSYWVRYINQQEKIKDIVLDKKKIKKQKYTAVHIEEDSCVLY